MTLNSTVFAVTATPPPPPPPPPPPATNQTFAGFYPNASVSLKVGQNVTIQWTTTLPASLAVTVYLYKGNATTSTYISSLGSTTNTGSFNCALSSTLLSGAYFFQIRTYDSTGLLHYSNLAFTLA